jgi:uncharacterized protein (TIGR03435 family)
MDMRAIGIVLLAASAALAQTPDARPTFEAAFIKANATGSGNSSANGTRGQVVMTNQSLKRLIERAYNVQPYQVTAPEWTENVRFDITAKYPEGTKPTDRPVMLKTLLEDRFKLTTHSETKELPGYALVVAKSGLKIKIVDKADGSGTSSNDQNNMMTLKVTTISMAEMADYLARQLGSAVIDSTGADGVYTFELHWSLEDPNGAPGDRVAFQFGAIQEAIGALGLRLQAQKVPVRMVVVDRVERVPTEN